MVTRRRKTRRKTKRKTTKKKKAFGGYRIHPDEHLGKIVGHKPVTPSEMTKKIWRHIKKKKLGKRK
jgi:chromatin remodeling complex protein RSC6